MQSEVAGFNAWKEAQYDQEIAPNFDRNLQSVLVRDSQTAGSASQLSRVQQVY
jgi:hypothetical protein